jgi:hypothetical protein
MPLSAKGNKKRPRGNTVLVAVGRVVFTDGVFMASQGMRTGHVNFAGSLQGQWQIIQQGCSPPSFNNPPLSTNNKNHLVTGWFSERLSVRIAGPTGFWPK